MAAIINQFLDEILNQFDNNNGLQYNNVERIFDYLDVAFEMNEYMTDKQQEAYATLQMNLYASKGAIEDCVEDIKHLRNLMLQ